MNSFIEGKYYLMSGRGQQWSDYEGPMEFSEAFSLLRRLCDHAYVTPETLPTVICYFDGKQLDLVRCDDGTYLNGKQFHTGSSIVYKEEMIWSSDQ